jgi:hypothetical protein
MQFLAGRRSNDWFRRICKEFNNDPSTQANGEARASTAATSISRSLIYQEKSNDRSNA